MNRDGLKETLGWLKVLVVLAATAEFSLINWIVNTADLIPLRVGAGVVTLVITWLILRWGRQAEAILVTLKGESV
jgi:hypothetical protein